MLVCRHGIEVNVTLHWFVHPLWFHELGGFTKESNIKFFTNWAKIAYEAFGKHLLETACTWNPNVPMSLGICCAVCKPFD